MRSDAERVDRLGQLRFELRPFGIAALRAERPRRCALREQHAQVRRAADADADDRRRARLSACGEHAVDDERANRIDAFGRNRHLQKRIVLRAAAFRNHLDLERVARFAPVDVNHRHLDAA